MATDFNEQKDYCKCCLRQIYNEPIPYNSKISELEFLGIGIPLYFYFILVCALITIIAFII